MADTEDVELAIAKKRRREREKAPFKPHRVSVPSYVLFPSVVKRNRWLDCVMVAVPDLRRIQLYYTKQPSFFSNPLAPQDLVLKFEVVPEVSAYTDTIELRGKSNVLCIQNVLEVGSVVGKELVVSFEKSEHRKIFRSYFPEVKNAEDLLLDSNSRWLRFGMYFAKKEAEKANHRMFIAKAVEAAAIAGPLVESGKQLDEWEYDYVARKANSAMFDESLILYNTILGEADFVGPFYVKVTSAPLRKSVAKNLRWRVGKPWLSCIVFMFNQSNSVIVLHPPQVSSKPLQPQTKKFWSEQVMMWRYSLGTKDMESSFLVAKLEEEPFQGKSNVLRLQNLIEEGRPEFAGRELIIAFQSADNRRTVVDQVECIKKAWCRSEELPNEKVNRRKALYFASVAHDESKFSKISAITALSPPPPRPVMLLEDRIPEESMHAVKITSPVSRRSEDTESIVSEVSKLSQPRQPRQTVDEDIDNLLDGEPTIKSMMGNMIGRLAGLFKTSDGINTDAINTDDINVDDDVEEFPRIERPRTVESEEPKESITTTMEEAPGKLTAEELKQISFDALLASDESVMFNSTVGLDDDSDSDSDEEVIPHEIPINKQLKTKQPFAGPYDVIVDVWQLKATAHAVTIDTETMPGLLFIYKQRRILIGVEPGDWRLQCGKEFNVAESNEELTLSIRGLLKEGESDPISVDLAFTSQETYDDVFQQLRLWNPSVNNESLPKAIRKQPSEEVIDTANEKGPFTVLVATQDSKRSSILRVKRKETWTAAQAFAIPTQGRVRIHWLGPPKGRSSVDRQDWSFKTGPETVQSDQQNFRGKKNILRLKGMKAENADTPEELVLSFDDHTERSTFVGHLRKWVRTEGLMVVAGNNNDKTLGELLANASKDLTESDDSESEFGSEIDKDEEVKSLIAFQDTEKIYCLECNQEYRREEMTDGAGGVFFTCPLDHMCVASMGEV